MPVVDSKPYALSDRLIDSPLLARSRAGGVVGLAFLAGGALTWLWLSPNTAPITPVTPSQRSRDPLNAPASAFNWFQQPEPSFAIPPYADRLKGVRIVLDPGHIGERDRPNWKRGPTGLREAEVNLRVARFLHEFLTASGAQVSMTRSKDESLDLDDGVDLKQRADLANSLPADLLLSIHHNGGPATANFTKVYYHGDGSDYPASLCAARYLVTGLNDALRLEQFPDSALESDYAIYPPPRNDGFAVLRGARVPAVLCESSFHSNPAEEERLRDPLYNRREAYGLFLGLARWAQAGLPRVALLDARTTRGRNPQSTITLRLDDGFPRGSQPVAQKIRRDSVVVSWDGKRPAFSLDKDGSELKVTINGPLPRGKELFVDFENIFGQHVLHPWIDVPR